MKGVFRGFSKLNGLLYERRDMTEMENPRTLVEEFIIPKASAKAFMLRSGQVLRVTAHEGKQVADIKFLNAHDYREQVSAWWSAHLNSHEGIGGTKKLKKLYSKPPWERVMLTVIDDKVGDHFFNGSCSPLIAGKFGIAPLGATCMDLYAQIIRPYGLTIADLDSAGTFNVFMPMRIKNDEYGTRQSVAPSCNKGDFIEFRAEMDILVLATSCPQTNIVNDFKAKAMKYQIYE